MFKPLRSISLLLVAASVTWANHGYAKSCPEALDVEVRKLHSKDTVNLCELHQAGKATLLVNTASNCGFTSQFKALEALHKKYQDKGLVVVGFPSNDFRQEEKQEKDTARVCYQNYGVTFTMSQHTKVRGDDAHPAFRYAASQTQKPRWNFNKYLIDASGEVTHFGSRMKPMESELETAVQQTLSF